MTRIFSKHLGRRLGKDLDLLHARVEALAGNGAPEWVPENAKIYIDFVSNRAWTEADGAVEINTLVGADNPATENSWGSTSKYISATLTEDGYPLDPDGDDTSTIAFIGSAKTLLLEGATIVSEFLAPEGIPALEFRTANHFQFKADGSFGVHVTWTVAPNANNSLALSGWGVGADNKIDSGAAFTEGAVSRVATTIIEDFAASSANGRAAIESDMSAEGWPFEVIGIAGSSSPIFTLRSITIYDPLPDTDGLSELSAI